MYLIYTTISGDIVKCNDVEIAMQMSCIAGNVVIDLSVMKRVVNSLTLVEINELVRP